MKAEQFCTHAKAEVTWKSGRVEEFKCELKKGGNPTKAFKNKVKAHRNFPTVESVTVTKY